MSVWECIRSSRIGRFVGRWRATIPWLLMCGFAALWLYDDANEDRRDSEQDRAAQQYARSARFELCRRFNEAGGLLKEAIDIATSPSNAPRFDFTAVPGFDDLDPEDQTYWRNLGRLLSSGGPSARSQALRHLADDKLVPIECR